MGKKILDLCEASCLRGKKLAYYFDSLSTFYIYAMKKYLFTSVLILVFLCSAYAQKKQTFQYSPGVNKKSITGTITKIKNSTLGDQKLTWLYVGDTIIHVWEKDLSKEMSVGKMFTFKGVQKLVGVKKHLEN